MKLTIVVRVLNQKQLTKEFIGQLDRMVAFVFLEIMNCTVEEKVFGIDFLPTLGLFNPDDLTKPIQSQKTSYWLLENDYWRIIGLDTGYNSYHLLFTDRWFIAFPDELMNWLREVVGLSPDMTDKRGLLFFTHHQLVSAWDKAPYINFPSQLASLLPENRTVLYMWGHEHRLSFYEKQTIRPGLLSDKTFTFYGRCVGNSGFPTLVTELPRRASDTSLLWYDDRLYQSPPGIFSPLPVGFNGFVSMKLVKPKNVNSDTSLFVEYKSLSLTNNDSGELTDKNPTLMAAEEWGVDINGSVFLTKPPFFNPEMIPSNHTQ